MFDSLSLFIYEPTIEYIYGKLAKAPSFPYNPSWGKRYGKVLVMYPV
jgi:hypothetical protein